MSFRCGIVGLPNVGKSTLFNAIMSSRKAEASNYPFCTIDPNIGTVIVPDTRLDELASIYNPKKIVPSTIEFVDIAGLVKGASKGEGLGNQFLANIREVDAIIHIVRCFEDDNVVHVNENINPRSDIEIIETELLLKDIETLENRIEKVKKSVRVGDKTAKTELDLLEKLYIHIANSRFARYFSVTLHDDEVNIIKELHLLTDKPVLYVANVDDKSVEGNNYSEIVKKIAEKESAKFLNLSLEMEFEIALLDDEEERKEFLTEMGLKKSGLNRLIKEGYSLLNLVTFFTANENELHSRTIPKGFTTIQAAGMIHTDFERGFIKAEIIKYEDLLELRSEHTLRDKGLISVEGKDYVIKDGEIVFYRFNV
jgi:GTP-binding protein YchF